MRKRKLHNALPKWDAALRELTFSGQLVHRFQRPAAVAEALLSTFQEEGWPKHIDDPLTPINGGSQAARLRKEVYALNRRLQNPLLRFYMDGTGEGVRWEPAPDCQP